MSARDGEQVHERPLEGEHGGVLVFVNGRCSKDLLVKRLAGPRSSTNRVIAPMLRRSLPITRLLP
jgi:hypothetical protein